MKHAFAVAAAVLAFPAALSAQSWVFLPGGVIGLNTHYTTHASFSCVSRFTYEGFSCAASGQGVVFTSHDAELAINFIGVDQDILITNQDHIISIGTFQSQLTGSGPFMFPQTPWNDVGDLFQLDVEVGNSTYPFRSYARFFGLADGTLRTAYLDPGFIVGGVPTVPAPPGYAYTAVTSVRDPIVLLRETGSTVLSGDVALSGIPEPSTLALVLPGLIGVFGLRGPRRPSSLEGKEMLTASRQTRDAQSEA